MLAWRRASRSAWPRESALCKRVLPPMMSALTMRNVMRNAWSTGSGDLQENPGGPSHTAAAALSNVARSAGPPRRGHRRQ